MQDKKCRACGSKNLRKKEFEIRHINSRTMAVNSSQKMLEIRCSDCEWSITDEVQPALV